MSLRFRPYFGLQDIVFSFWVVRVDVFEVSAPNGLALGADASGGQSMSEAEDGMTVNLSVEVALNGSSNLFSWFTVAAAIALGIDFARQLSRKSD